MTSPCFFIYLDFIGPLFNWSAHLFTCKYTAGYTRPCIHRARAEVTRLCEFLHVENSEIVAVVGRVWHGIAALPMLQPLKGSSHRVTVTWTSNRINLVMRSIGSLRASLRVKNNYQPAFRFRAGRFFTFFNRDGPTDCLWLEAEKKKSRQTLVRYVDAGSTCLGTLS